MTVLRIIVKALNTTSTHIEQIIEVHKARE